MQINKIKATGLFLLTLIAISCEREYDSPPANTIPTGNLLSIADLKKMYKGTKHIFTGDTSGTGDTSVYAVVTADEQTGNIYKEVYIKDATGAMNLGLQYSGGLYEGDSIRVYLKNTFLTDDNDLIRIDSVDVDKNIIKQKTGAIVEPLSLTISQILTGTYQSYLAKVDNVQFSNDALNQTYADKANLASRNINLEDCDGNIVIIRTSGYASFADQQVASGNGSFIGIVGVYGSDIQMYIRNTDDISLTGTRCGDTTSGNALVDKDFEDLSITSGGWTTQNVTGAQAWSTYTFSGETFAKMSGYDGGDNANEDWLISPSYSTTGLTTITLTFRTAKNYTGDDISVLVSTNYDGTSAPSTATWTTLTAALSAGSWAWTDSGNIDLSSYTGTKVFIAIKFTSTTSASATWEVDDVKVTAN